MNRRVAAVHVCVPRYLPHVIRLLMISLATPAAMAQTSTPPASSSTTAPSSSSSDKQTVTLNEVMVTANRRREPEREVPMHVDTVQAATLQQLGAKNLNDYVSYQPGVFFASAGGAGQGELVMRGVSTGNQTSPTVSLYIDDVPVGGSTAYAASATFLFDPALLDLDHIEFLYGPQGTLYGAGSMGGLVKYVTVKPDLSGFSGNVGGDVSNTNRGGTSYSEHASVNLPLVKDKVALRASVVDQHITGVYRAVGETPAGGADRTHTKGARLQLEIDPIDKLTLNVTAMAQKIMADGLSMGDFNLQGQPISGGPYNRALNHREPFTQTLQLYSFHAGYDFDWATVDWISAYQDFVNHSVQDYPDSFLGLLNQIGPLFGVNQPLSSLYVDSQYTVHKASQEIRVTSKKNQTFDWLFGVWLNREDVWEQYVLQGDNVPPPGTAPLIAQAVDSRFEEYAGYGDLTWHINPTLDLTVGARASGNTQTLSNFEDGAFAGSQGGFREHVKDQDVTKMVTLSWRPTSTDNFYMRASTGYRPGGLQAPLQSTLLVPNPNATSTFGSDNLESYELGYKGSYLDHHLNVGLDGYDIEWHHMQLYTYTLGNTIIQNAGDARIKGIEMQGNYSNGPWELGASGTYTDAFTDNGAPQLGIQPDARLPYSARWAGTVSGKYKFIVAGTDAYIGAVVRGSSRRNAGFDGDTSDPNFKLPGFMFLDLNVGVNLRGGANVDFYVRNVTNRQVPIGTLNDEAVNFLATVGGPMLVQMSTPRTVGMAFNVPF
ncbi:TonB-dependent receptor [Dyella nitratireducens]|uniref:TonB-dependent receptor n=1 Tax=Dyella nitratireducens TaxID=1849580 RepID=A0ABQ1G055_9GAMM|nr:TonB-dependent receptor [Dyella nitratireducens]GGA34106.1 TonB-dependent receptor [Dyella nitratireducens]GLQ40816.1 TonB-dependent receptor [Dyella nitratireducens]